LPAKEFLNGDFSQLSNATKPLVPAGVVLTPEEIANNTVGGLGLRFITIPQRLKNPTTAKFIDLYYPKSSLNARLIRSVGCRALHRILARARRAIWLR
jgi:hypothetical protein